MNMSSNDTFWGIRCVWLRYFDVYCKNLAYGLMTTFAEPILYVLSFGYGLGSMIGRVNLGGIDLSYRQFIFAGLVAQAVLFQGFFDGAYGSFIRMYYQKIFKAMACTPVTLSEVLWGELLWDASKATFSASVVLLIGTVVGDFRWAGALLCIPVCFLGALIFGSFGLWVSGASKTLEQISYPNYLVVFPMFLFCGVYFPLTQLPLPLQKFAWFLPLTSLLSLVRTLTLGTPFAIQALPILFVWLVILVWGSRRQMINRLIK